MTLVDDIIKWFKAPKTIKGIVGMIAIIILLAADFAYWAGAIDVDDQGGGSDGGGVEEEQNGTLFLDVDDIHTGTLLIPSGGIIINEGNSIARHPFEVKENATLGYVNVSFQGTKLRPDFDLRVYGPDDSLVSESATEETDEVLELDEKDFNRTGPGTYVAEVENYSSLNIEYTLTIQIYIEIPIEESDEEEGE